MSSAENIEEEIDNLRRLSATIKSAGHVLASDWIELAYSRKLNRTRPENVDWRAIYKDNTDAIVKCDAMIVEATVRSFGIGYQIATATRLHKPILILRRDKVENDIMAVGISEESAHFKVYDAKTLESTVRTFLQDNDISAKDLRFNFFINRKIYNYLRWRAYKTGKTKSEIIRGLIQQEIDKKGDSIN